MGSVICPPNSTFRTKALIPPTVRVLPVEVHNWVPVQELPLDKRKCLAQCDFSFPRGRSQPLTSWWGIPRPSSLASIQGFSEGLSTFQTPGGIGWGLVAAISQLNISCPILLSLPTNKCGFPKHTLIKSLHAYLYLNLFPEELNLGYPETKQRC